MASVNLADTVASQVCDSGCASRMSLPSRYERGEEQAHRSYIADVAALHGVFADIAGPIPASPCYAVADSSRSRTGA
jgi:hypothetical protein